MCAGCSVVIPCAGYRSGRQSRASSTASSIIGAASIEERYRLRQQARAAKDAQDPEG